MTGNCESNRAKELMPKIFIEVCPEPDNKLFSKHDFSEGEYFTALEKHLFMVGSRTHKKIIDYLKSDRTDILELK